MMEFKDPKTGEVLFSSEQDIPEEKLPGIIAKVQEIKARNKAISGYSPGTQQSALAAEDRTNMWGKLKEELAYDPLRDKSISGLEQAKRWALKPAVTALKGAGALGQSEEGFISSIPVAMQRGQSPLDPEFYKTIGRSVTGEAPTEYGDIARNVGIPERAAAGMGLALSAITPGSAEAAKLVGRGARAGGTALNRLLGKAGKGSARIQLELFSRGHPEAASYALSKNFKMIKPGQTVSAIENEVSDAAAKGQRAVDSVQKRANTVFRYGLNRAKHDVIDTSGVYGQADNIIAPAEKEGIEGLGMRWVTKKNKKTGVETKKLIGNKRIGGSDDLAGVIQDLSEKETHRISKLRITLNELDGIIEKSGKGESIGTKAVHAQASALASNLRAAINAQSPTMKRFNEKYGEMMKYMEPDKAAKLPGIKDLLATKAQGGTKLSHYFELPHEAKVALDEFNANLPKGRQFVDDLKSASANAMYKDWKPRASFSLMAPGAIGYQITKNPAYLPLMVAGGLVSSPRASVLGHKGLTNAVNMGTAAKLKFLASPKGKAIADLVGGGIINPGLLKGATRNAFMSREEQRSQ